MLGGAPVAAAGALLRARENEAIASDAGTFVPAPPESPCEAAGCVHAKAPVLPAAGALAPSAFAIAGPAAAADEEPNTGAVAAFPVAASPAAVEAAVPKAVKALLPPKMLAALDPEAAAAELLKVPPQGLVIGAAGTAPKVAEDEAAPVAANPKALPEPKVVGAPNAGAVEPKEAADVTTPYAGVLDLLANSVVPPKAGAVEADVDPNCVEVPNAAPELPKVPHAGAEAAAVLDGVSEKAGTALLLAPKRLVPGPRAPRAAVVLGSGGLAVGVPGVAAVQKKKAVGHQHTACTRGTPPCLHPESSPHAIHSVCLLQDQPSFLVHSQEQQAICSQK